MYCQVLVAETNNSLEQRTTGAFPLTQTNSSDGAILFSDLNTKKIIRRNSWTEIQIPQDAIDRINAFAMEEKKPPTKNPNISIGLETRSVDEVSLGEDLDVLPHTHHEMMKPNQEVPEIDPINENQEDEEFEADFVEDIHALEEEDET
jgi:hypothetical protein